MAFKDVVSVVGGLMGIAGAMTAVAVAVMQYFATRTELLSVECRYRHKVEAIEASLAIQFYSGIYRQHRSAAATAEAAHKGDPTSPEKLEAYRSAVDEQDAARQVIDDANAQNRMAQEGLERCGAFSA